jgi:hypothetical protein
MKVGPGSWAYATAFDPGSSRGAVGAQSRAGWSGQMRSWVLRRPFGAAAPLRAVADHRVFRRLTARRRQR